MRNPSCLTVRDLACDSALIDGETGEDGRSHFHTPMAKRAGKLAALGLTGRPPKTEDREADRTTML